MSITENSTFATIVGVILTLLIMLLLGSYGYTWNGLEEERKEKNDWRKAHNEQLEKKFLEVRQSQEKLTDAVNKTSDKTTELLQQLLDEQRKANQLRMSPNKRREQ